MKKTILVIILSLIFGFTALAEAALIDQGGGLIYCGTLDITLLQNANYAGTVMTWDGAVAWADDLTYYDSVRGVTYDDWRPGDQAVYVSDTTKARRELDWQPQTSVSEGIEKLFDWVVANRELFA